MEYVSLIISLIAILVSVIVAIKQWRQTRNLGLFDKRYLLIKEVEANEKVHVLDIKLLFPNLSNQYDDLKTIQNEIDEIESLIGKYFECLSETKQMPEDDVKREFAEKLALIDNDNEEINFKHFCEERIFTIQLPYCSEPTILNYYELSKRLAIIRTKFEISKKDLITKMLEIINCEK